VKELLDELTPVFFVNNNHISAIDAFLLEFRSLTDAQRVRRCDFFDFHADHLHLCGSGQLLSHCVARNDSRQWRCNGKTKMSFDAAPNRFRDILELQTSVHGRSLAGLAAARAAGGAGWHSACEAVRSRPDPKNVVASVFPTTTPSHDRTDAHAAV
jgi:hypothetical protein